MGTGDTWINAAIGAAVTIALSFSGLSPLLGGGVAGYLQGEPPGRGATVGALSGVFATLPLLILLALGFVLFAAVSPVPGGLEVLIILVIMLPVLVLWVVGLSAAGGYIGAYLHEETR